MDRLRTINSVMRSCRRGEVARGILRGIEGQIGECQIVALIANETLSDRSGLLEMRTFQRFTELFERFCLQLVHGPFKTTFMDGLLW